MERQSRDWMDWAAFLLLLTQVALMLPRKDQTQKRKKPSNRRSRRKHKR